MSTSFRRVVTSHGHGSKAVVHINDILPMEVADPKLGVTSALIWTTDQTPADLSRKTDAGKPDLGIPPPPHGSSFRFVEFAPESEETRKMPADYMSNVLGKAHMPGGWPTRHPAMHRTKTLDYIIVLSGEIDMLLDDTEVHLKAGDVVVQHGTNHAWVNRGKVPCRIAAVLLDAKPV